MIEFFITFSSGDFENNPGIIQWGNPKSIPAYGHSRLQHGSHISLQSLIDRARELNTPQGQFYDDMTIVESERKTPKQRGSYIIIDDKPGGIGRVIHPDSTITENVTKVLVVRKANGTLRTSYPITNQYTKDLICRGKAVLIEIQ